MPARSQPLREGDLLAALDLGSNSFHMVVARYVLGQLRIVDRLREMVRLAEGLDGQGGLDPRVTARAIDCLARFGQRIASLPPQRVRVIATNTVRSLRTPRAFLLPAETALGHGIDVVSGREEARLIYLGVAHGLPPKGERRLVIDIGGGSTEFIIGEGFAPLERESLQMGCVASTRRFFADGKLGRKRWREALVEVSAEFQQFGATYRARGWQETIGASGTIRAISAIHKAMKLSSGAITRDGLAQVRDRILDAEEIGKIKLPGLSAERRPVIAGGVLVLEAAFNELGLDRMRVCETALREGVLYDMLGRAQLRDPREDSIAALAERYAVDREQAQRVEASALALFDQVAENWHLGPDERLMLAWAARIHEIGLTIAHSQYHQHGAYLIAHSDIAGFSNEEQGQLAALVRNQRRTLAMAAIEALPPRMVEATQRCAILLRLAVLLHRSHADQKAPQPRLTVAPRHLELSLQRNWLSGHPLTRSDLDAERDYLAEIGMFLTVRTV